MPNITGSTETTYFENDDVNSAIYGKTGGSKGNNVNFESNWRSIGFDASRSSSTYQDGAKVNPDHIYVNFVIKY